MKPRQPMPYERRILVTALVAAFLPSVAALLLALRGGFDGKTIWTVATVVFAAMFLVLIILRDYVEFPLRTMSNIITALREDDYSLRARTPRRDDALGDVMHEINELSEMLEARKLEALEASALLRAVLAEVDAAIFAFDEESRLRIVNRAGERLLAMPAERMSGATAGELGLDDLLAENAPEAIERSFRGGSGRWSVRRSTFREKGLPHRLLVITDITRALREEESQAWRKLVRVLSHELNNSLAPIKSIAQTLESVTARERLPDDWKGEVTRGAAVIAARAESLTRFTSAYAQLAKLPQPAKREVDLAEMIRRVAELEARVAVAVSGPPLILEADADQVEQLLINVVKNAADASLDTGGAVAIRWRVNRSDVEVEVIDEGRGLQSDANLFVPFFTTKPEGSGIGLVLSRQIAEAHGGTLTLENRIDRRGCVARLVLPLR